MTAESALTAAEISSRLTAMVQHLDQNLTGELRGEVIALLRRDAGSPRAAFSVLAMLALLDDCLRVAHLAIDADGVSDLDEIDRVLALADVAARRYFQVLPAYEKFGDDTAVGRAELAAFFHAHREDDGPFGGRHRTAWRGLALCKLIAARASHEPLLRDHERMLVRVMESVFAGRETDAEQTVRRRLRDLFEPEDAIGEDPRVVAFCRTDGPAVFSSVAYGSQIWERDPFDVESIHADARDVFYGEVERAITPSQRATAHGRSLLILGQSGSGKTHLMRAFRSYVHARRLGYAGYLQMTSEVGDYARYVLQNLISSLERPYDTPALTDSSLMYLSDGLAEHAAVPVADLEQLRIAELTVEDLTHLVGNMVSHLVRAPELKELDSDLLQALLLLQRSDAALERRVVKYLRGDALTPHEVALLGGLAPRDQPEDAPRAIEQLGKLMFHLHQSALVLLVDQVEDALPAGDGGAQLQRAVDVLRKISDAVPSAVVVIACLEDVYDHVRRKLTQSTIDRLEREPGLVRLATERRRDEIEAMLALRLEYLYGALDAPWREDDPVFPFSPEAIDAVVNQRARDCLAYFRRFQDDCIRAGGLVDRQRAEPEDDAGVRHEDLDLLWNDAKLVSAPVPDDDEALLVTLARGLAACADELGAPIGTSIEQGPDGARLKITPPGGALPRLVQVCNRPAQGGHLGQQLDELRRAASIGLVPVAMRTSEWTFGPKSSVARKLGELVAAGGMKLSITDDELRALAAYERLAAAHGGSADFEQWRLHSRPLAELSCVQQLLGADASSGVPMQEMSTRLHTMPGIAATTRAPAAAAALSVTKRAQTAPVAGALGIRLGVLRAMRADPVAIDVEAWRAHAAFLGASGSGATALALHVVEQLLERGVSALLVDRDGALARYASPAWWDDRPADPAAAGRKAALRGKIDVALYTPGDASGRPLPLPVIPGGMAEMTTQERDQVAQAAAGGLAAMMAYGRGESHRRREAILKKAIELHAESGAGLDALRDTIAKPDPALLGAVGNLTRHFRALAEDLDSLYLQRAHLFGTDGDDTLDIHALLAPRDGRPQLAIISIAALTEVAVAQFWVSRLLIELGRTVRARLKKDLDAVALFTAAEAYVPANAAPAARAPMFDLLRRARAGGLGILLASGDPGELDYAARKNVETWLVGRVVDGHAVERMKNLIAGYPNVASRLATLGAGSFFMLQGGAMAELKADAPLMTPAPLAVAEIAALARAR